MGLAYHRADLHYKVVCLRDVSRHRRLFQIQIYSSNTGKWRISKQSIRKSDYPGDSTLFGFVVYWNGAMHWIPGSFDLVYFKLDEEKLKMISLPERDLSSPRDETPLYFGGIWKPSAFGGIY
ncbi:hypothetical protein HanRHA438_Chr03g0128641 [Helianthus annuus]|nr:hypothetical protein HanHA300_Chr03g0097511 [Helianthus annuus]KAJ0608499.1 hypothetical protein HanHA89_Chr03g0109211 [Helianthus annuus]KAJ0768563.1 hypothetical protein HanLR1_Chr03g0102581 [Helianthus annuus]KAJ0936238.1 hypothetical protein HanRHA438_Chr03g0128491 [Helianthus annuus]KAJ0936252.1 hypothetical protein HanRHA438_Chr03g0128641 [Helianthus annuus]